MVMLPLAGILEGAFCLLAVGDKGKPCESPWFLVGLLAIWLWVKTNGIPFWGRCTTHLKSILVGIGMFTGNTIWILTHGHVEFGIRSIRSEKHLD